MSSPDAIALERYSAALKVLAALPTDVAVLRALGEPTLLRASELHAAAGRLLGAAGAAIAGELAHRSRPELGSDGLARRTGHRTVENLLKFTTGATKQQVITAVKTGVLLTEIADDGKVDSVTGEVMTPSQPWLRLVGRAIVAGTISTSAAQAIGAGLGLPNSAVTSQQLETAAAELTARAIAGVDADRLWRDARGLRDELDLAGVRVREEERREARGVTHFPLPAGGGRVIATLDTENYATFVAFYDGLTSPKRGGVRFVDEAQAAHARRIADDPRSTAQLALDGLLQLLKAGATVDDSVLLGSGAPVIRVTVAEAALETGVGLARIDGQSDPVSIETALRLLCEGNELRIGFDPNGTHIDHGEDHRLFSRRQREVLAAKFGGCMDPDCDRPPSWCEAHHIKHWVRDHGKTVIDNGILLCKYHHLKYHRDGYEITRDQLGQYWKVPPPSAHAEQADTGQADTGQAGAADTDSAHVDAEHADAQQPPRLMPFKTHNLNDLFGRGAVLRRIERVPVAS